MQACILCGDNRSKPIYHNNRVDIVQCVSCGLVRQADYTTTLSGLSEEFEDVEKYYQIRHSFDDSDLRLDPRKIAITSDIRHQINQLIKPGGKVLDVGCGRGEFLTSLEESGLAVLGVEPDPALASFVQYKLGIPVVASMYRGSLFPPDSFDAITFIQVVEHLQNPLKTLSVAHTHLKSGGLLVVDVPSFNNPRVLLYRLTQISKLVQRDFIPSHCYYFTRRTLSQLVEKAGFKVLKAQTGRYSVKFGENILTSALDRAADDLGIGGITLYARKLG